MISRRQFFLALPILPLIAKALFRVRAACLHRRYLSRYMRISSIASQTTWVDLTEDDEKDVAQP